MGNMVSLQDPVILYHGTSIANAMAILSSDGFDLRRCSPTAMLGRGVYGSRYLLNTRRHF